MNNKELKEVLSLRLENLSLHHRLVSLDLDNVNAAIKAEGEKEAAEKKETDQEA